MKKKGHRLFIFIACIIFVSLCTAVFTYRVSGNESRNRIQEELAQDIIRFHVRANSDSDEDQKRKLAVKDAVVGYLSPLLAESQSIDESKEILSESMVDIENIAHETLMAHGGDSKVNVYFEESYFPMKAYADVTFPPGVYEAFRIDIGEHCGKNWWCVLYPPLCFVDSTCGVLPDDSKEKLKNILTDDEYNAITKVRYKYRFKYLTFLNGLFK